ncbi:hypothetical protein RvY_04025 [Ramazzottius varieornatus]|uniref:Hexosyltransferase n=1 Tax=Ramazzottius varieornatus TaxID=947166 RepID=A0A1D1UQ44_RAMVA|nr:hypothetical protein RvY_04025 [Ramazzottius varieornatus]
MLARKKIILLSFAIAFVVFYSLIYTITRLTVQHRDLSVRKVEPAKYSDFVPVGLSTLPFLECRSRNAFASRLDVQLCVLRSNDANSLERHLRNATNQTQVYIVQQPERVSNEDKTKLLTDGFISCQVVLVNNASVPRFIIYTHSAAQNVKLRQKVRETWASREVLQRNRAVNIFVLGSSLSQTIQANVLSESRAYHDIIQGDFIDSYRNLTLKHRFALKFLQNLTSCFIDATSYPLAFKTDDDVVLDLDAFTGFFLRFHASPPPRTFFCANVLINELAPRDPFFKWYVAEEEYAGAVYPPYCYGNAYLFTWDMVGTLYEESLRVKELWVDDVYFSGILTSSFGKVIFVELPFQSPIVNIATNPEDVLRMGKWLVHTWGNDEASDDYWIGFQAKRSLTARAVFKASVKHRTGETFDYFST